MDFQSICDQLKDLLTEAKKVFNSAVVVKTEADDILAFAQKTKQTADELLAEVKRREAVVTRFESIEKAQNELNALRESLVAAEGVLVDKKNAIEKESQRIQAEAGQKMTDMRLERQALNEARQALEKEKAEYKTKMFEEMKKKLQG